MSDMPPSLDPEVALLGAVLIRGARALDDAALTGIGARHFYAPRHATIWDTAHSLTSQGLPVDPVTMARALGPDLPRVGGPAALHTLLECCPSPLSAQIYARQVVEAATRRALAAAGARITHLGAPDSTQPVLEAVRAAHDALADAGSAITGTLDADLDADLDAIIDTIEHGTTPPTPTGLADLDTLLGGGLRHGTLTIIGARPGVGKSVIGLQLATHTALAGHVAGVTTLEMDPQDLIMRAVCARSGVDYGRVQASPRVTLTDSEWRAIAGASADLRASGLVITRRSAASVEQIRADIRDVTRTKGAPSVWVVDYLQLVTPADRRVVREQQVAAMSRDLKTLALSTGVAVVVLAQLSRDGEKAQRPPVLTDLRESGAIEQDADVVVLLHRGEDQPGELGVRVAKNRRGQCGAVALEFDGSRQRVMTRRWSPSSAAR